MKRCVILWAISFLCMAMPVKAENEELFMPHIRLTNAHDKSCVYEYDLEGCMVVGRAPDLCDVALVDEPTVSARQCRLYTECGKVYLMDLDGTNPTYHNNLKVIEDVALRNGDEEIPLM